MVVTGRMVAVAAVLALLVLAVPSWTTTAVWLVVVATAWTLDRAFAPAPSSVQVSRQGTGRVRAGEPAELALRLTNTGDRTFRGVVRDAWPPSLVMTPDRHVLTLGPGATRRVISTAVSTRRGSRTPDRLTVRSLGPLGLAGRQASSRLPGRLDVLPAFTSRQHLPSKLARLRDLEGRTVVLHRGQGTEFDSLREYVGGDDVRSIDWRATARASDVMVRTWRPERDRHVVIVLDCGRTSAARVGDAPRLDAAIEGTLLLAALAGRAGDRVDVLAWDRQVRGVAHGRTEALASATAMLAHATSSLLETDWNRLQVELADRARQRALLVLLTSLDPAPARSGLLPVVATLAKKHLVVVGAVGDPSIAEMNRSRADVTSTYRAAAAAAFLSERRDVAERLGRRGVEVIDTMPEQLAPALADRYLALKAAGRL
jgi:uncharacterized protein (DUF58 family)